MKKRCRRKGHKWWTVMAARTSEDDWTVLVCCKRCGAFEEEGLPDQVMEWVKEQHDG